MNTKDFFWERLVIREYFLSLPREEVWSILVPFCLKAYKTATIGQAERRVHFLDTIQQDLIDRHLNGEELIMPKKREFYPDWTFARIELTTEQKEAFTNQREEGNVDPVELLIIAIEEGYKFSCKYQPDKGTWLATLSGTTVSPHNANTSLTAFHRSFEEAIALLMFKHFDVSAQKQWPTQSASDNWG